MSLNPETIEEYFENYEWNYNRTSETTWVTGVRTSVASFRIFLRLTEHWVYFVINPYVVAPGDESHRFRFYYNVLRLNLDMNMTKFGLDGDGDLFLAVELPTENFTFTHFSDALNGLSHHAERLYSDVFNLAHNPTLIDGPFDSELVIDTDDERADEGGANEAPSLNTSARQKHSFPRPMDDIDLPEETESSDDRAIIAGREVKIVDDGEGMRIEFETMHDLDPDEPVAATNDSTDEPSAELSDTFRVEGDGPEQRDSNEPTNEDSSQIDDENS